MEWPPNFVNKIAGDGAGPNKESKNTSQWQREPKHIFLQWRRTQKRGPKKFPTEIGVFVVFRRFQWETFLDRIFAFGASEGKCALARVATAKCSQISYWSAPSPEILLPKFGLFACYRDLGLYQHRFHFMVSRVSFTHNPMKPAKHHETHETPCSTTMKHHNPP